MFSPDGSAVYFTSDRGGRPQVYKVGAGGGSVCLHERMGNTPRTASITCRTAFAPI